MPTIVVRRYPAWLRHYHLLARELISWPPRETARIQLHGLRRGVALRN